MNLISHSIELEETSIGKEANVANALGHPHGHLCAMAPSPGTPVRGERPHRRRRSGSPAAPAAGAAAGAMDVDARGPARVYCPVEGCPCAHPRRARGWGNLATMHAHVDAHLSGALQGEVPSSWLQAQGRQRCSVCGLSVSTRFGIHPTCRPAAREAAGAGAPRLTDGPPLPSWLR